MINNCIGLAHLGFYVKSMDETVDFYCNKLGFKVIFEREKQTEIETIKIKFLELGNFRIEVIEKPSVNFPSEGCFQHVAISVSDIDETFKQLKENGIECSDIVCDPITLGGSKWINVIGPSGEHIEFNKVG